MKTTGKKLLSLLTVASVLAAPVTMGVSAEEFAAENGVNDTIVTAAENQATISVDTQDKLIEAVKTAEDGAVIEITASMEITQSIVVDKPVTITGGNNGAQITTAMQDAFKLSGGAVLDGLRVTLTVNEGVAQIVYMGSNSTVQGCDFEGQYQDGDPGVTRAVVVAPGAADVVIDNNGFHHLRQPAYINGGAEVNATDNAVTGTRGFVVCADADVSFTDNHFGNNAMDIAIIPSDTSANNYDTAKLTAISTANDGCTVENQVIGLTAEDGAFIVDSQEALDKVLAEIDANAPADTVVRFAEGVYNDVINVGKPVTVTAEAGAEFAAGVCINSKNVTLDGLRFTGVSKMKWDPNPVSVSAGYVSGVVVQNCAFDCVTPVKKSGGICVVGMTDPVIKNNTINGYENATFITSSTGVEFAGNKVTPAKGSTQRGLKCVGCSDVAVEGNEFSGFQANFGSFLLGNALEVENGCSDFTVTENAFLDNSTIYFRDDEAAFEGQMDLTDNYWGGAEPSAGQIAQKNLDQVILKSYYEEYDAETGELTGEVKLPEAEEQVDAKISFEQIEGTNQFTVYANGYLPDGTTKAKIQNLVAMELTLAVEGETPDDQFSIVGFEPASEDLVVVPQEKDGCYLIHTYADGNTDNGENDQTGVKIALGTVTIGGYGSGSINLAADSEGWMRRRMNDNIVQSGKLSGEEASFELTQTTHKLTVNIAFNNNLGEGNTAAYQDMQIKVTGTDGSEAVYAIGEGGIPYTAEGVTTDLTLTENVRYTVVVSGKGYRTAKKSVVLKEDTEIKFWNNVNDEADANGETKNFLAGEIVADGKINVYDLSAVVSYFGEIDLNTSGAAHEYVKYDLNRDGKVDSKDVAMVLVSWNE